MVRAQVLSEGSSPLRSGGESIFKLFRRRKYNSMVEYLSFKQRVLGSSPSTFRVTISPLRGSSRRSTRRWQGEILIKKKLKVNRSEANDKEKSFKMNLLFWNEIKLLFPSPICNIIFHEEICFSFAKKRQRNLRM